MTRRHQLLGAEVSYYTGKVRAYLRYKGIPFEEVRARLEVYRDVIIPRTGVRFIPVLISDDDVAVQDSAAIIEFLEERHGGVSIHPEGGVQQLVSLLFHLYGDEWLVLPAMHYRWNVPENREWITREFGRLSRPDASAEEQVAAGQMGAVPFAGALPPLGVDEVTAPAVETSYRAFLGEFDRHLGDHPYLLGGRPCLGDFALFGPLYAHLYRDPASGRLMKELAPRVADWVERMRDGRPPVGEFLADDAVPPTLVPMLARMFREFGPVLAGTIERLAEAEPRPDGTLPRAIGAQAFTLEGATGQRKVYPFNAWRWQAARDHYFQNLGGQARARADGLLEQVGGAALMRMPLRRLARVNNRLAFA